MYDVFVYCSTGKQILGRAWRNLKEKNYNFLLYFLMNDTGCRSVVAAYQWWSFAFCTGNYVFVASPIRQFYKRRQKESPHKKTDNKIIF